MASLTLKTNENYDFGCSDTQGEEEKAQPSPQLFLKFIIIFTSQPPLLPYFLNESAPPISVKGKFRARGMIGGPPISPH